MPEPSKPTEVTPGSSTSHVANDSPLQRLMSSAATRLNPAASMAGGFGVGDRWRMFGATNRPIPSRQTETATESARSGPRRRLLPVSGVLASLALLSDIPWLVLRRDAVATAAAAREARSSDDSDDDDDEGDDDVENRATLDSLLEEIDLGVSGDPAVTTKSSGESGSDATAKAAASRRRRRAAVPCCAICLEALHLPSRSSSDRTAHSHTEPPPTNATTATTGPYDTDRRSETQHRTRHIDRDRGKVKKKHRAVHQLACKHTFHRKCIRSWIRRHPTCPLCRSHVVSWTF